MADQGILSTIEKRLRDLEEEKVLWLRLRALHKGESASVDALRGQHGLFAEVWENATASIEEGASTAKAVTARKPLPPTQAILDLVAEQPAGITVSGLLDALEHNVISKSGDKRRLLSWTAGELVKNRRLIKENGRFYPVIPNVRGTRAGH